MDDMKGVMPTPAATHRAILDLMISSIGLLYGPSMYILELRSFYQIYQ